MTAMNRREMLKMGSACSLAAFATAIALPADEPKAENNHAPVPRWDVFELVLTGPSNGNPFIDVHLAATFTLEHRMVKVNGFYDGSRHLQTALHARHRRRLGLFNQQQCRRARR